MRRSLIVEDILLIEPAYKNKYPPIGLMKIAYFHRYIMHDYVRFAKGRLPEGLENKKWDRVYVTTLFTFEWENTKKALQYMIPEHEGKIINISSMWGLVGSANEVHYSTSKAALIGMTKALAKELGPSNIQVNCIAPGVIETDMLNDVDEDTIEMLKYDTPLMRIGKPMDIARCALFLASEGGDFITGQVISSNGGFVIN